MTGKIFSSLNAKQRIVHICDKGTFKEITAPCLKKPSPHLQYLNLPVKEDDGVVIGMGAIGSYKLLLISQDGTFYGGSVGEIHGAKIKGLFDYASIYHPDAIIFVIDSGGVRLQEANAGLVALSEVMKSLLNVRYDGIPVIAIIPGKIGAFGGMGILARLCTKIIMTEHAKMGLSGPEVIETLKGVEEFNSHNKDIVYETVGARQRYKICEINMLVDDKVNAIKKAIVKIMKELGKKPESFYEEVLAECLILKNRLERYKSE